MATEVLTLISCNPFFSAHPIDFFKKGQVIKLGNVTITQFEFHGSIVTINGKKPDGSEYTSDLHLRSDDILLLKEFIH